MHFITIFRPKDQDRLKFTHIIETEKSGKGVRFEVFTAVTMKIGVFWVVTPCGSCKNRRFGGTWHCEEIPNTWYFFAAYVGC
jgi:hypothetical protein